MIVDCMVRCCYMLVHKLEIRYVNTQNIGSPIITNVQMHRIFNCGFTSPIRKALSAYEIKILITT